MGHGLDLPEPEMQSLVAPVIVQWRVEATDEADSGGDCGMPMGAVEAGRRTDWPRIAEDLIKKGISSRTLAVARGSDLVKDNTFSKNNGNPVRYWRKPYDTMIPGMPTNTQLIV